MTHNAKDWIRVFLMVFVTLTAALMLLLVHRIPTSLGRLGEMLMTLQTVFGYLLLTVGLTILIAKLIKPKDVVFGSVGKVKYLKDKDHAGK